MPSPATRLRASKQGLGRLRAPAQRDARMSPDQQALTTDNVVLVEFEAAQVRDQRAQRRCGLQPRQRGAEAEVNAVPETHVCRLAGDVKDVRVREVGWIT